MAEAEGEPPRAATSLYRSFLNVGGLTLASRVLGFIRDALVAAVLGTGPAADAYLAAFVHDYNRTRLRCLGYTAPIEALNNLTGHNTCAGGSCSYDRTSLPADLDAGSTSARAADAGAFAGGDNLHPERVLALVVRGGGGAAQRDALDPDRQSSA